MAVSFFFQEGLKRLSSDSLSIENRNTRDHSCRRQVDCKLKVVKRLGRGCYLEHTERAQSELGQKKKMRSLVQIPTLHRLMLVNQRKLCLCLQQKEAPFVFGDPSYNRAPIISTVEFWVQC